MRVLATNYSSASQTVLKAVIIKLGHQVEIASGGVAALAGLRCADGPKLAVIDSKLPGLDGFEVCRRLKGDESDWGVFVVLMTSENDRTEALTAVEAGADDFLQKPFTSIELTARLRIAERLIDERQRRKAGAAGETAESPAIVPVSSTDGKNGRRLFSGDHTPLNALSAFSNLDTLLVKTFDEMGLGKATPQDPASVKITPDFSLFSSVVLPEKDEWVDVVLEMDTRSAAALFMAMAGAEGTMEDLVDMAGETLNIVQGAIKTALQDAFVDVLTPVIPFNVPAEKKEFFAMADSGYSQHVFALQGITLRVSLFPHAASVVSKYLDDVQICDVVAESVKLPGSPNLTFVNKGTMMNNSHLQKLRDMAGSGLVKMRFSTIVPPEMSARLVRN